MDESLVNYSAYEPSSAAIDRSFGTSVDESVSASSSRSSRSAPDSRLLRWQPLRPEVLAAEKELELLGDRIAELAARIHVATYHLLVLIREFDARQGWDGGFPSCAHWLNWRTGLGIVAAREQVRVARALGNLPLISAAMSRGELSYSKVRALTRIATPANEEQLLDFATVGAAAHVERLVRSWRRADRIEEAERDARRRSSRSLVAFTDEDGMLVIRGRLDPETGAVFLRALEAAQDRLYEQSRPSTATERDEPELEQRRADALGLVAESALAADLDPGTRGDRYLVTVHVDAAVLQAPTSDDGRPGMAMLEDGVDASAESSRRLTCDCATVTMTHDSTGEVLNVGRKRRTIAPALRRALRVRDRTCRFPGCNVTVCDGHHVRHWADGGQTRLDNLVLLCRRHHVAVHEQGYRMELTGDGVARFFHPRGWEIVAAPPPPAGFSSSDAMLAEYVAARGVAVGPRTASATCDDARVDYYVTIDALRVPGSGPPRVGAPEPPPSAMERLSRGHS